LALVVDAGNAYVQRRRIQNAMDAGAQAGAIAFAQNKTIGNITAAVQQYGQANGATISSNNIYFVVENTSGNNLVYKLGGNPYPIGNWGSGNTPPTKLPADSSGLPVVGIQVEGSNNFPTYFAGVLGIKQMPVSAAAASFAKCGACRSSDLFPIIMSASKFVQDGVHTEQTDPQNSTYVLWENNQIQAGSFGYVFWTSDNSNTTPLIANMNNTNNSGTWAVGDWVNGNSSITAYSDSNVRAALASRINGTLSQYVTIPVYDSVTGTGTTTKYHIKGFARFKLTCYRFSSSLTAGSCTYLNPGANDKYIEGKLQQWIDPQADGGCDNYGVCTVKVRPPVTNTRALVGSVKINKLSFRDLPPQTSHVSVDVANVLDLSSSMGWAFNGGSSPANERISAARTALTTFNNTMKTNMTNNPTWRDQLALITFPYRTTGTSYNVACPNTNTSQNPSVNFYQTGEVKHALGGTTTWINTINTTISGLGATNNTPTAGAIKKARETLLATSRPNNIPVMIIASDGRANVRVDSGKYSGNNADFLACNDPALADMTNEATISKGSGIVIFVVGIGSEWANTDVATHFKATASVDTDVTKPHYLPAPTAAQMAAVYAGIADRVENIGGEACRVIQTEAFGPGATITVKNIATGALFSTTTTSSGEFVFADIPEGTYEFQATSVYLSPFNYNKYTLGVGGIPLTALPRVTVGTGSGTYRADLFLSIDPSTTPSCQ
jgi:hypothetical protein